MNCKRSPLHRGLQSATFLQECLFETWRWSNGWYCFAFRACQIERHGERCRAFVYVFTFGLLVAIDPRVQVIWGKIFFGGLKSGILKKFRECSRVIYLIGHQGWHTTSCHLLGSNASPQLRCSKGVFHPKWTIFAVRIFEVRLPHDEMKDILFPLVLVISTYTRHINNI